jgi:curli biogenesis system outer membrane secretion channel CsgG
MASRGGWAAAALAATTAAATALTGCLQTTELGGASGFATGSGGVTAGAQGAQSNLPRCDAPLGTVALVEDQDVNFSRYNLESPLPVLRLMISQSGCFNVVDRGGAITRIQQEQILTGSQGSRQRLAGAQYFLTPNVVFSDANSGGGTGSLAALGGLLPGGLGGTVGALAGNLGLQRSEVQSVLFLTQTSTGIQVAAAEGSAKNSDLSVGGLGGLAGLGGAASAYASTAMGKLVIGSLVDAYGKLVAQLRAEAAAPTG